MEILNRSTDVYIALCDIPYEEFVYKEWERQMELIGLINHQCKYRKIKLSSLYQEPGQILYMKLVYLPLNPWQKKWLNICNILKVKSMERSNYGLA